MRSKCLGELRVGVGGQFPRLGSNSLGTAVIPKGKTKVMQNFWERGCCRRRGGGGGVGGKQGVLGHWNWNLLGMGLLSITISQGLFSLVYVSPPLNVNYKVILLYLNTHFRPHLR